MFNESLCILKVPLLSINKRKPLIVHISVGRHVILWGMFAQIEFALDLHCLDPTEHKTRDGQFFFTPEPIFLRGVEMTPPRGPRDIIKVPKTSLNMHKTHVNVLLTYRKTGMLIPVVHSDLTLS